MKNRKFVLCALVVLAVMAAVMLVISGTSEAKVPFSKNGVYVYDTARVIEAGEEKYINDMLAELEIKSGVKFTTVSVKDLYGEDINEYAERVFQSHEMNKQTSGVFVFSKADKVAAVKTTAGLENVLSEKDIENIFRRHYTPNIEKREYEQAVCGPVKSIIGWISSGYGVDVTVLKFSTQYEGNPFIDLGIIMITAIALMGGVIYLNSKKKGGAA